MPIEKEIKLEWCNNWIRKTFSKLLQGRTGIEVGCFWKLAEKSGLWTMGTYGTPMSYSLEKLTKMETVRDETGKHLYDVFRLK